MAIDAESFVGSLESSGTTVFMINSEDLIYDVKSSSEAQHKQIGLSFYDLFSIADHPRILSLLTQSRCDSASSQLFREPLESYNGEPVTMLMGTLDADRSDHLYCIMPNWGGSPTASSNDPGDNFLEQTTKSCAGASIRPAVRSLHRLANQIAAMRLNAEIAELGIHDEPINRTELQLAIDNIVNIARTIELGIMQRVPQLPDAHEVSD